MQTPGPPFSIQMGSPSGFRRLFITLFPLARVYIDDSYCICIDPLQRLSAYPKFWFCARKNFPLSFLSHLSPSHTPTPDAIIHSRSDLFNGSLFRIRSTALPC